MDREQLALELERLMNQVRLKEPPRELMADYLSGVNAKIDRGIKSHGFGFPHLAVVFAVGLTIVGLAYCFFLRFQQEPASSNETPPVIAMEANVGAPLMAPPYDRNELRGRDESRYYQSKEIVPQARDREQLSTPEVLSIDEEMAVLEAFQEEFQDEANDLFGDEGLLEELALLDEVELSPVSVIRA